MWKTGRYPLATTYKYCWIIFGLVGFYLPCFQDVYIEEQIEKILAKINELEEAHKIKMEEYRYKKLSKDRDLSCLVNPSIIKATERVHACYYVGAMVQ